MERILRHQEEARLAVEAERLQKEKARAEKLAAKSVFPSQTEVEKSSLISTETEGSAQTLVPPTGTLSGILNRHLNLQGLKRRAGLISNETGQPLGLPEKEPVKEAPDISSPPPSLPRPQSPPLKPLAKQPPNDEYTLNQQYLSGGGQSQPRPPVRNGNDVMPGGFPHSVNIASKGPSPPPAPSSGIRECRCCDF